MTTELKPPPTPVRLHDHPEHCWTWTETELRWIAARDAQWLALVGELQRDAERLDYLQRAGATVDLVWPLRFRIGGLRDTSNEDIRAAIDAARGSKGGV